MKEASEIECPDLVVIIERIRIGFGEPIGMTLLYLVVANKVLVDSLKAWISHASFRISTHTSVTRVCSIQAYQNNGIRTSVHMCRMNAMNEGPRVPLNSWAIWFISGTVQDEFHQGKPQ